MLVQSVPSAVVRRAQASRVRPRPICRRATAAQRRRTDQLRLAQARHYHVDTRVNQNFPFRYEGASKTRFTVGFVAFVAAGVSVPFLAKKAAA